MCLDSMNVFPSTSRSHQVVLKRDRLFLSLLYAAMPNAGRSSATVQQRSPKETTLFPSTPPSSPTEWKWSVEAPTSTALRTDRVTCLTPAWSWLEPSVTRAKWVHDSGGVCFYLVTDQRVYWCTFLFALSSFYRVRGKIFVGVLFLCWLQTLNHKWTGFLV